MVHKITLGWCGGRRGGDKGEAAGIEWNLRSVIMDLWGGRGSHCQQSSLEAEMIKQVTPRVVGRPALPSLRFQPLRSSQTREREPLDLGSFSTAATGSKYLGKLPSCFWQKSCPPPVSPAPHLRALHILGAPAHIQSPSPTLRAPHPHSEPLTHTRSPSHPESLLFGFSTLPSPLLGV